MSNIWKWSGGALAQNKKEHFQKNCINRLRIFEKSFSLRFFKKNYGKEFRHGFLFHHKYRYACSRLWKSLLRQHHFSIRPLCFLLQQIFIAGTLNISHFLLVNVVEETNSDLVLCGNALCQHQIGILCEGRVNVMLNSYRRCKLMHVSTITESRSGGSTSVVVNRLVELDDEFEYILPDHPIEPAVIQHELGNVIRENSKNNQQTLANEIIDHSENDAIRIWKMPKW